MTSRIAFVSCAYAKRRPEQPAWQQILDQVPDLDLLLLLGDTAYMSWEGRDWRIDDLRKCYEAQFGIAAFSQLIKRVPTLAIWDDHDCGYNDIHGAEDRQRVRESRKLFDHWMAFAVNAGRPEMYDVYDKLPEVRILMLDGRSERTSPGAAPATMLGSGQEAWLWKQLDPSQVDQRPITIVANGVGLTKGSEVEVVQAYPDFCDKLLEQLSFRKDPSGVPGDCGRRALYLAGDIHRNHFEEHPDVGIYEALSSGVSCFVPGTYEDPDKKKNPFTPDRYCDNWALITIDEQNVTIDFHGLPNAPGFGRQNNFTRVIRRSDWQLVK